MNTSVRINVRVLMGQAVAQFSRLAAQMKMMEAAAAKSSTVGARFGQTWSNSFKQIELAGKRLGQSGRVLLWNFTIPLVAGFAALESQFLKVSKAAAVLTQVYSTSTGEAKQFGVANERLDSDLATLNKIALELSNGFGVARSEVMDLMVVFGRAGASGVQLARYTELALQMMTAFGVASTDASDAIMTAAVSYQLTGNQINVAMAEIGFAANKTRADVGTLAAGFVKAAPTAQQLGIDVDHLTAMLAVMQQAGFKGAEAGTALNFAFTRLVKATPEAISLMKRIGLDIEASSFAAANGSKRMDMIVGALDKLTGSQRAYAVAVMFGVRQQPKLTALIADALREGGLYSTLLGEMADKQGMLAYMQNQVILSMDNMDTKFKILKTQVVNNMMAIAVMLSPALLALLGIIQDLTRKFAELGNTAGGRSIQRWIVLGAVLLALAGPLAILASSFTVLIGLVGHVVTILAGAAAALLSPWALVAAGMAALIIFSKRFRDGFVQVLLTLYSAVLRVAMMIYEALQWINPFAHHSPSLVERTRDGVAVMVSYWRNLSPILGIMDAAAKRVREFGAAMEALGLSTKKADEAAARADIGRVGGPAALAAYDAMIASNDDLAASLVRIDAQYRTHYKVVDRANLAMVESQKKIDAAEASLKGLQAQQDAAQKSLSKLGDPQALQSQADAASSMARQLAAAGNSDLARQFAEQAQAMGDQAAQAKKAQAAVDAVGAQIDSQTSALDALRAQHDAISASYDAEKTKLDALEQGYRSVEQAIQDNSAAMKDAAQQASSMAAEMDKAAKAGAGASGSGKRDPFAQFDAAGGASFPEAIGANAVPGVLPPDTGGTLDDFLKQVQKDNADRMRKLFPNPFGMVGDWLNGVKKAWGNVTAFFDGAFSNLGGGGGGGLSAQMAGWAKPLGDAVDGAKKKFSDLASAFQPTIDSLVAGFDGVRTGLASMFSELAGPLERARGAIANSLGVVISIFSDIANVSGKGVLTVFRLIGDFWATNGPAIGKIVGVVAGFFLDWYRLLLDIATFLVKTLWPVFKFGLQGVWDIVIGLVKVFSGFFQMVVQLLTGDFSKAWDGFKRMLSGLWQIVKGLGKVLIAALVAFVVYLAGSFLSAVWAALSGLLPLVARLVPRLVKGLGEFTWGFLKILGELPFKIFPVLEEMVPPMLRFFSGLPARLWDVMVNEVGMAWDLAKLIGGKIVEWAPGVLKAMADFGGKIPGWIWDAVKAGAEALFKLDVWMVEKVGSFYKGVGEKFGEFGGKIPGWIWNAFKMVGGGLIKLDAWIGGKIIEWTPKVLKAMADFGGKIPGWIWNAFKMVGGGLIKLDAWIGGKIIEWTPKVLKAMADFGGKIPGWIWDAFKYVGGKIIDLAGWIGGRLSAARDYVYGHAKGLGEKIVQGIGDRISQTFNNFIDLPGKMYGMLKTAIRWALDNFKSLGANLVDGIVQGLAGAAYRVYDALMDMAKEAWHKVTHFWDVNSPSKRMMKGVGAPIAEGMALGIERNSHLATDAMMGMARQAYDAMTSLAGPADLTLPVLTQNVRLNYLNSPLTAVQGISGDVGGVNGSTLAMASGGAATNVYAPNITVETHPAEQQDPMALGQTLAFAMRNGV